ncbi:hypothetical protein LWI28_017441 [Acer negundo]|uniref:Amine oxidase domain-containing protein n=1 Tax=Acer negundo TaxID=4023 RepID=A0AAD5NSC3_ACENE|nr:hypothetical protein LWI28_013708 [Acer negundo]KAI9177624.1 hypothetical protein LWI28_017441 [Acer negundo]
MPLSLTLSPLFSTPYTVQTLTPSPSTPKRHRFKFLLQTSATKPQPQSYHKDRVLIIGAGLAGLAAATTLHSQRIPFLLLEASDAVGGRVRTDSVEGFLLDRGFQIFITAYPEAQKLLDYNTLNLQKFYSGAKIYYNGQFHTVADPLRHFRDSVMSLANPIGSVLDKLLIGFMRIRVLGKSDYDILTASEVPVVDLLRNIELGTTSRLFDFIFKCLALGENTIPAKGIGEIPNQLAAKLPADSILLNTKVVSIDFDEPDSPNVRLENGEILKTQLGVVVAVEEPEVDKLLAGSRKPVQRKTGRNTVCLYFSADQIPVKDPVLFLNGSGKGIVNNMFFATNVAPSYGPPGKALVSVSLIGLFSDVSDDDLTAEVIRELTGWFGESVVSSWRHLRTYRIGFAQPNQCPPTDLMKDPKSGSGVYLCGDFMISATFDGALVSGRRAVEALLRDTSLTRI